MSKKPRPLPPAFLTLVRGGIGGVDVSADHIELHAIAAPPPIRR